MKLGFISCAARPGAIVTSFGRRLAVKSECIVIGPKKVNCLFALTRSVQGRASRSDFLPFFFRSLKVVTLFSDQNIYTFC